MGPLEIETTMMDKAYPREEGGHLEKSSAKSSEPSSTFQELQSISVAHQILGEFLSVLAQQDGYVEIANRLRAAILEDKPSEVTIRRALFGDDPL